MRIRRTALALTLVAVAAAGCGGDEDSASISVDDPIGAPEGFEAGPEAPAVGPTIAKSGSVDVEVPRPDISAAAQQVVDIATSTRVGGFLVSSVVDTREGFASGDVLVKVPDARFEEVVGELDRVGDVTRQALEGRDVGPRPPAKSTPAERREAEAAEAAAAYSPIDVSITAAAPPPPPEEPLFERALTTAKTISLAIASALVLGASVAVPVGLVLLAVWLAATRLAKRFKPGLGA